MSYLFAGRREIDLRVALRKLRELFGIRVVRVDGGAHLWGSFLKASLIDEINHVALPVADGSPGNRLFETGEPT